MARMAYYVWSAAVPLSLYVTRGVGSTLREGVLRRPAPQPLDTTIDTEGALASAHVLLALTPVQTVSPTLEHLRGLVRSGARDLHALLDACARRQQRRSFSRLFRQPCYREENVRLRAATDTLKSRVQLCISMMPMFASDWRPALVSTPATAVPVVPAGSAGLLQEAGAALVHVFKRAVRREFPDSSDPEDADDEAEDDNEADAAGSTD